MRKDRVHWVAYFLGLNVVVFYLPLGGFVNRLLALLVVVALDMLLCRAFPGLQGTPETQDPPYVRFSRYLEKKINPYVGKRQFSLSVLVLLSLLVGEVFFLHWFVLAEDPDDIGVLLLLAVDIMLLYQGFRGFSRWWGIAEPRSVKDGSAETRQDGGGSAAP
jgi:hypothetical protein